MPRIHVLCDSTCFSLNVFDVNKGTTGRCGPLW